MWRRFWVLLLGCFILSLAQAAAAERALLEARGQGVTAASLRASAAYRALAAKAISKGSVKVIVGLKVPYGSPAGLAPQALKQQNGEVAAASAAVQARFSSAIKRFPNSFRAFDNYPFLALEVTAADLSRLASDPQVLSITENFTMKLLLSKSVPLIRANEAWEAGYQGTGQTVAIIDTGIDKAHPFLSGKVVSEACYSVSAWCLGGGTSSTEPGSGTPCGAAPLKPLSNGGSEFISAECVHGTHVAGIVAGSLTDGRLAGVAPGAKIISIMVLSQQKSDPVPVVSVSDLQSGLERVLALKDQFNIAAVNLSIGAGLDNPADCATIDVSVANRIKELRDAGIAVVAASGNDNKTYSIDWPACLPEVVSVGSVADSTSTTPCVPYGRVASDMDAYAADKVVCSSNTSQTLSLFAPGAQIESSVPSQPGSMPDPANPDGLFNTIEGTSMATAHVSAAWAILKQKVPSASVSEILETMKSTGKPITDYRNPAIVKPRIDVKAALDALIAPPVRHRLGVNFAGGGSGSVSFAPAGSLSACTSSCSNSYVEGTSVNLTATPDANMTFAGWSGDCTGTTCSVSMSAAKSVTANFEKVAQMTPKALTFTKGGNGSGTITFTVKRKSVTCSDSCGQDYALGSSIRLKVTPSPGSVFDGWSEGCAGKRLTCTMKLASPGKVTATFSLLPNYALSYNKLGAGDGSLQVKVGTAVSSWVTDSSASYRSGTVIKLKAIPAAGKKFGGWSGVCKGTRSTCSFTLRTDSVVKATFN